MTTENARPEKRNRVESGAVDSLLSEAAADGETNASASVSAVAATQASNLIIQLVSETGETLGRDC